MAWTAGQRYIAEFLGTFGLLLSVTGAALFSLNLPTGALGLTDPDGRVLLISIALGAGVIGMIYAFGDVSGAHFNPAVTIGMWLTGRTQSRDVVPYIVAQVLGGLLAVGLLAAVAHGSNTLWTTVTGANGPALASQGYSGNGAPYAMAMGSVFLLEVTFTFFLVLVILFATRSDSFSKNLAPLGIGLTLLMTNLVAIPLDGASVNPARSFAPAVISGMVSWSNNGWALQQNWLFWVAPILGGILAAAVERVMRPRPG
jgi:aquaporin Z